MYRKTMLAAILAGAGLIWVKRRFFSGKKTEQSKGEGDIILHHANTEDDKIVNDIPANTNEGEGDIILHRANTEDDKIVNDIPANTNEFMQYPSAELPKGLIPDHEIILSERHRQMINRAIQRPSVNPLALLNQIIPGIRYEHEIIRNPPAIIKVDCVIYGRYFSTYGPTKKAAKLLISLSAMNYFYGYTQQDLEYKPNTSGDEDHGFPTTNTGEEDNILHRTKREADNQIVNDLPADINEGEGDIILHRANTEDDKIVNDIPANTNEFMQYPSAELPEGLIPDHEIILSERHRQMINRAIQRPSVNPLALLNQIIPGIRYEHEIIRNPPAIIKVDCVIYGRYFSTYGPTKKAAKLLISLLAMNYFYGYTQQDLEYKPNTSGDEDHGFPTTNTADEDILHRAKREADNQIVNDLLADINEIVHFSCFEMPKPFSRNCDIIPPQPNHLMTEMECKKQSLNPVVILHNLVPRLTYKAHVLSNPPANILVETTIRGIRFKAQGLSKQIAKKLISIAALFYFYGYNHLISTEDGWTPPLNLKRIR